MRKFVALAVGLLLCGLVAISSAPTERSAVMVQMPDVQLNSGGPVVSKFKQLSTAVDELGRQSRYPFSAGPPGMFNVVPDPSGAIAANGKPVANLHIGYADGSPLLTVAPSKIGKQGFTIFDTTGNTLFNTDPDVGYGLASPIESIPLYPYDPPNFGISGSSFTPLWTGAVQPINPAVQGQILLKMVSTASNSAIEARWHYSSSGYSSYSVVSTLSGTTAGTYYANSPAQVLLLPATEIGVVAQVALETRMSAGAGTSYATPNWFFGASAHDAATKGGW
jgi:hypothetical protein